MLVEATSSVLNILSGLKCVNWIIIYYLLIDFYKAMEEIHKLRAQINSIVQANFPGVDTGYSSNLRPPSVLQVCSV